MERPVFSADSLRDLEEQAHKARNWVDPVAAVLVSLGPVIDGARQCRSYHHLVLQIAHEAAQVVANALRREKPEEVESNFYLDGSNAAKPSFSFSVPMRWGMPPAFGIDNELRIVEGLDCEHARAIAYSKESIERLTENVLVDAAVWSAVHNAKDSPRWARSTGTLTYRGQVAKRIKNVEQAKRVVAILDEFQQFGWTEHIESPFSGGKNSSLIRETVKSLNDGCELIKFAADGNASGITWRPM
jgi:hypothetical protein